MKRFLVPFLKILSLCAAIALCGLLYFVSIGAFSDAPAIGYLHSAHQPPYADLDLFENQFSSRKISFLESDPAVPQSEAAQFLIDQGAEVLIVSQETNELDPILLETAKNNGTTLLLLGNCPDHKVLDGYDKAWYVGSDSALGGELLGKQLALAFRDGTISDLNGDRLLQYAFFEQSGSPAAEHLAESTMLECEHYGVYSNRIVYADENGQPLEWNAEQLREQPKPELLVCTSEKDTRSAYALAQELGWLDGDAPTRIGTVVENKDLAQKLIDEQITIAVSYYDVDAVSRYTAQFALNAIDHEFIGQDSDLKSTTDGRFFVPFGLLTTIENN